MMLDGSRATGRLQRAEGRAHVAFAAAPGGARLTGLHQSGCAKAMLPRSPGRVPEAVFLNTSGGLTAGDRLTFSLDLAAGARAVGTTQTAERAYASLEGPAADVRTDLSLASGASLDWLPQETILFERAAMARRTRAELAPGARLLMVETLVLGRAAMGEVLRNVRLLDRREVVRGGVPLWIDPVEIGAEALARAGDPALFGGDRAFSTVALIADGAEDGLGPARDALAGVTRDGHGVRAVASAWNGRLVARLAAPDAFPLRRALRSLFATLRGGAPMPRVWQD